MTRTDDELREEIKHHHWWHQIELRPGIVTPGPSDCEKLKDIYGIPGDLTGETVLDVGCWDGYYSFLCERRGASKVVASDLWEPAGRGAFDLAREELGSDVIPLPADVYDLDIHLEERFGVVLFLGVLYHLKHPMLGLEAVAERTRPDGKVIVDTVISHPEYPRPVMEFFAGSELSDDPTNWWAPNPAAMQVMLETAGFYDVTCPVPDYYGNRAVFHARKLSDEAIIVRNNLESRQRRKYQLPPYKETP